MLRSKILRLTILMLSIGGSMFAFDKARLTSDVTGKNGARTGATAQVRALISQGKLDEAQQALNTLESFKIRTWGALQGLKAEIDNARRAGVTPAAPAVPAATTTTTTTADTAKEEAAAAEQGFSALVTASVSNLEKLIEKIKTTKNAALVKRFREEESVIGGQLNTAIEEVQKYMALSVKPALTSSESALLMTLRSKKDALIDEIKTLNKRLVDLASGTIQPIKQNKNASVDIYGIGRLHDEPADEQLLADETVSLLGAGEGYMEPTASDIQRLKRAADAKARLDARDADEARAREERMLGDFYGEESKRSSATAEPAAAAYVGRPRSGSESSSSSSSSSAPHRSTTYGSYQNEDEL